jgi:hypothetical protein
MRISSHLPAELWREVTRAAVYLYNQTPRYYYNWNTPYERFFTSLTMRNGVQITDQKPQQAHLRVYGCKAYAASSTYLNKRERLKCLNPHNWIRYLVGYDSTNVYRIWNPKKNRIERVRDVIFDEDCVFPGTIDQLKDDFWDVKLSSGRLNESIYKGIKQPTHGLQSRNLADIVFSAVDGYMCISVINTGA